MRTRALVSVILLIVMTLLMSGCGSKLACSDAKGGVRCETITSVYNSIQTGEKSSKKPWNYHYEKGGKLEGNDSSESQNARIREEGDISSEIVRNLDIQDRKPLRLPTKIIGIWVAPWVDAQGDLRKPEMIYSEVQDKRGRWLFGEEESRTHSVTPPVRKVISEGEEKEREKEKKKITTGKAKELKDPQTPQVGGQR